MQNIEVWPRLCGFSSQVVCVVEVGGLVVERGMQLGVAGAGRWGEGGADVERRDSLAADGVCVLIIGTNTWVPYFQCAPDKLQILELVKSARNFAVVSIQLGACLSFPRQVMRLVGCAPCLALKRP